MSQAKYIRTHQTSGGTRFGNAFLVANHYSHSLAAFRELLTEAQKSFPELTEDDIECRTVRESSWCNNCAVIRFSVPADTVKDGWFNCETLPNLDV